MIKTEHERQTDLPIGVLLNMRQYKFRGNSLSEIINSKPVTRNSCISFSTTISMFEVRLRVLKAPTSYSSSARNLLIKLHPWVRAKASQLPKVPTCSCHGVKLPFNLATSWVDAKVQKPSPQMGLKPQAIRRHPMNTQMTDVTEY